MDSAVRMSQYVNESCFKYRSMVKIELIGTEDGSVTGPVCRSADPFEFIPRVF